MARDTLPSFVTRESYLTIAYARAMGAASWTALGQVSSISPESTVNEKTYQRVGDENERRVGVSTKHDVTLGVYLQNNLSEIALVLNQARPGGGWTAGSTVKLDSTLTVDIKLENYDGTAGTSVSQFAEYINNFRPLTLSIPIEADGNARTAQIRGSADAFYLMPKPEA